MLRYRVVAGTIKVTEELEREMREKLGLPPDEEPETWGPGPMRDVYRAWKMIRALEGRG